MMSNRDVTVRKQTADKQIWIELLRVAAILAVIVWHVSGRRVKDQNILFTPDWGVLVFFNSITRFGVNCFVMISGALFLSPLKKNITIKNIWSKYIKRVATLFIAWSVIYVIWKLYFTNSFSDITIKTFIKEVIRGHYHLWYLYMIAGLYIVTPLLREIAKQKKLTEYFLIINITFSVIPSILVVNPGLQSFYYGILNNKMFLMMIQGYVVYYLLGHYLNTYEIKKKHRILIYILGLLGIGYAIFSGVLYSRQLGEMSEVTYGNLNFYIMFYSISIFVFFKYEVAGSRICSKYSKIICHLGNTTLGIYIVHIIFLDIIERLLGPHLNKHVLMDIPLLALAVVLPSYLFTILLKRIPVLNKYLL